MCIVFTDHEFFNFSLLVIFLTVLLQGWIILQAISLMSFKNWELSALVCDKLRSLWGPKCRKRRGRWWWAKSETFIQANNQNTKWSIKYKRKTESFNLMESKLGYRHTGAGRQERKMTDTLTKGDWDSLYTGWWFRSVETVGESKTRWTKSQSTR